MHITKHGLNFIKSFERLVLRPYICPAGIMSIGFGHVIRFYERAEFKHGITEQIACELLAQDVHIAERAVNKLVNAPLTHGQFDALVSFCFNLGSGAFQRSTLRQKINRQEHDDVPDELLRWVYASGRRLRGLVRRRAAEAELYQR